MNVTQEVLQTTIDESNQIYIVGNRNLEKDETFKNYNFTIVGELVESGISGKYLANVVIVNKDTKKEIKREYFCTITRKVDNENYVFLNHLESSDLENQI